MSHARRSRASLTRIPLLAAVAVLLLAGGAARRAEARWFDLHAGVRGGGVVGWGSASGTSSDFFERTRGPAAGFEVGAKLLIFDLSANFTQVFDGNGRAGTLIQFLLGVEIDVPVGDQKLRSGQSRSIFRPGLSGGVGFGTPRPVSPPLSNDQISDKGPVSQLKLAYEYFLNPFVGVGLEGDAGYHYFLWGGAVNSAQSSSGYHLIGMGTLTFHLGY
jgi:hypothetical protein